MKLHTLDIEGFGPFRARQHIDFDAFDGDGLFLISGRTGAGKSSILDAVCFALYGTIPRYSAGEKRLRSDYSDDGEITEVVLEFSVVSGRYRVARSPEYARPKKRGEGTTTQKATVELARLTESGWHGLGARNVDVDKELLREILQLTREQFLQVILLAQNGFARFLTAKNADRLDVLRTLFGTQRFRSYTDDLAARRQALNAQVSEGMSVVEAKLADAEGICHEAQRARQADQAADFARLDEARSSDVHGAERGAAAPDAGAGTHAGAGAGFEHEATPEAAAPADGDPGDVAPPVAVTAGERLAQLTEQIPRLGAQLGEAEELLAQAEQIQTSAAAEWERARTRQTMQRERDVARAALALCDQRSPDVDALRLRFAAVQRAETVRASLAAVISATAEHDAAGAAAARALAEWRAQAREDDPRVEDAAAAAASHAATFRAIAAAALAAVGELTTAVGLESERDSRVADVVKATSAHADAEVVLAGVIQRLADLPLQLATLDERLRELAPRATSLATAEAVVVESRAQCEAATLAEGAAADLRRSEATQLASGEALLLATTEITDLVRRRLRGYASELALGLVDGSPCAVCGSLNHPSPSQSDEEPVTDELIASAEEATAQAKQRDTEATVETTEARLALATAQRASGGLTIAEAEAKLAAAATSLAQAQSAHDESTEIDAQRTVLLHEQQTAAAAREAAQVALGEAATTLTAATERQRNDEETITMARGEYVSVSARRAGEAARAEAAEAVASTLEQTELRREARLSAERHCDRALADADFASAQLATEALMPSAERVAAAEDIRAFDDERARLRGILERVDTPDLPAESLTTDAEESAAARAIGEVRLHQARVARVAQATRQLERGVEAARSALESVGDAADRLAIVRRLADSVAGHEPNTFNMSLETFVLAAELEQIVAEANIRLDDMSDGRYQLAHTDARAAYGAASGLGIEVVDAHTGRGRPATSLSGGETFLASLALALGLADVVTARAGGVKLDTLFIDEGFGSLDSETLDTAMRTLDELRQGGRTVGVISHVEAMHHQIPSRLTVRTQADGSSVVVHDDSATIEG